MGAHLREGAYSRGRLLTSDEKNVGGLFEGELNRGRGLIRGNTVVYSNIILETYVPGWALIIEYCLFFERSMSTQRKKYKKNISVRERSFTT